MKDNNTKQKNDIKAAATQKKFASTIKPLKTVKSAPIISIKQDPIVESQPSFVQVDEQLRTSEESEQQGQAPPDESLLQTKADPLAMMKALLAQAQTGQQPNGKEKAAKIAAAKKKAVMNIQKKLTDNIMKRLDDNQPMVEVAKKLKVLQQYQPYIQDMERRMAILKTVEPILIQAINTLTKVIDIKGMMPKALPPPPPPEPLPEPEPIAPSAPAGVDLAKLLQQAMGQVPAAPAPAPTMAELAQDDTGSLVSQLQGLGGSLGGLDLSSLGLG